MRRETDKYIQRRLACLMSYVSRNEKQPHKLNFFYHSWSGSQILNIFTLEICSISILGTVHPALSRSFRFQTYRERGFPRKNILSRFFIFFRGSIPRKNTLSRFFSAKEYSFAVFRKSAKKHLTHKQTAKEDFRERKNRERAGWTVCTFLKKTDFICPREVQKILCEIKISEPCNTNSYLVKLA